MVYKRNLEKTFTKGPRTHPPPTLVDDHIMDRDREFMNNLLQSVDRIFKTQSYAFLTVELLLNKHVSEQLMYSLN